MQYWKYTKSPKMLQVKKRGSISTKKSKEIFLTCLFLIGANHIIKKQLNNELKFYIMVINGYPQELPGVMKLIN